MCVCLYVLALRQEDQSVASKSQFIPSAVGPRDWSQGTRLLQQVPCQQPCSCYECLESLVLYAGRSRYCSSPYLWYISENVDFEVIISGWCHYCNHCASFVCWISLEGWLSIIVNCLRNTIVPQSDENKWGPDVILRFSVRESTQGRSALSEAEGWRQRPRNVNNRIFGSAIGWRSEQVTTSTENHWVVQANVSVRWLMDVGNCGTVRLTFPSQFHHSRQGVLRLCEQD